jgi:hypothetical protein
MNAEPPPLPQNAPSNLKRFVWKKDGVRFMGFFVIIAAWHAYRDYNEKGLFDPVEYGALAAAFVVLVGLDRLRGMVDHKAK